MAHDLRQLLWVVVAGVAGGAVAFGFGIAVYVLGSFFLMAAHVERRPFGVSLRELIREAALAALIQPLVPLFYFVGRRMDGLLVRRAPPGKTPIVFVHGYMQNRVDFLGIARALARKGLGPLYGINYPWFSTLERNAARLDRFVARVCEETGAPAVDLVCHSMGGLVAIEMMRDEARKDALKVRRLVTIATPHAGVLWRGPILGSGGAALRRGSKVLEAHAGHTLKVPALSVFSTHDNVVHPKESSSLAHRGGIDFEVDGAAHLSILFSPVVIEQVASFLSESGA